jgi:hypothetical protein
MPTSTSLGPPRVHVIDRMVAEWRSLGRSAGAVRSLREVARRDHFLAALVLDESGDCPCPTPFDLVEHLRSARGRLEREEAASVIRILLREVDVDPFVCRLLVQSLLPGLITVAGKLRWGQGGEWQTSEEFFGELLTTTWLVIQEWAGQDRPYAVLDLLSAIRCRLRRQLFRFKDQVSRTVPLERDRRDRCAPAESDLETLARVLVELHEDGMRADDVQVLYSHHVLGYSMAELAALTGRDRRALYARRDRGRRRVCA